MQVTNYTNMMSKPMAGLYEMDSTSENSTLLPVQEKNNPMEISWFKFFVEDKKFRNIIQNRITEIKIAFEEKMNIYLANIINSEIDSEDAHQFWEEFKSECKSFFTEKLTKIESKLVEHSLTVDEAFKNLDDFLTLSLQTLQNTFQLVSKTRQSQSQKVVIKCERVQETPNILAAKIKHLKFLRPASFCIGSAKIEQVYNNTNGCPKKKKIPENSLRILRAWLLENLSDPYPSKNVKEELAVRAEIHPKQVHNWFINARGRVCKKLYKNEKFGSLVEKCYIDSINR